VSSDRSQPSGAHVHSIANSSIGSSESPSTLVEGFQAAEAE
jgi:hypothetical protein